MIPTYIFLGLLTFFQIEKKNAKAHISRSSRKHSQKTNAVTEEVVKFSPSTIQNDEFPDWEII